MSTPSFSRSRARSRTPIRFVKAFLRIEQDKSLVIPERDIDVFIPVGALPTGYDWNAIGEDVRAWLKTQRSLLPEGISQRVCMVGCSSKKGSFPLTLNVCVTSMQGMPGACRIARYAVPDDLGDVVERALRAKLPKLVDTPASKHILLLEHDQMMHSSFNIYAEIKRRESSFPNLKDIDEIWFADTAGLQTVTFLLIDQRGLVKLLTFHNGVLTKRRDDSARSWMRHPDQT